MMQSVNHYSDFTLRFLPQGCHSLCIRLMAKRGRTGTFLLGIEMTPEEITTRISIGMQSSEDLITMRLIGLIDMLLGENVFINLELVIKATDIIKSKTNPKVIWCRTELIVLG